MKKLTIGVIVVALIGLGVWLTLHYGATPPQVLGTPSASAYYSCDAGKNIQASYYEDSSTVAQNGQPVPGGSAKVVLSDGRTLTLKQTASADGTRYSDGDPQKQQGQTGAETLAFWSKGNTALVLENNQVQTYTGCISVPADPGGLPQVYSSGQNGFAIRYPANYTVDQTYKYQNMGPGKDIAGVKFTIDPMVATGTNLGSDTYLSVEQLPQAQSCTANMFLDLPKNTKAQTITDSNVQYSFASTTGAAAGNRYEEQVYAMVGSSPCVAVRYYIHYGAIQDYPQGAVKEFDHAALVAMFDAVRRTLTLAH